MIATFVIIYFVAIGINAWFEYRKDSRVEAIAYHFWVGSLNKKGFPKNDNGTWMDAWQLYNHWNTKIDKKPWMLHTIKETKKKYLVGNAEPSVGFIRKQKPKT